MTLMKVSSFAAGQWIAPGANARPIASAITGLPLAEAGGADLDMQKMIDYARNVGGPALREMGFHDRAKMLKALAMHLGQHKQELYDLSFDTGATQSDHMIDIDGGVGTMFVFASKGRREMPDGKVYIDGEIEQLSRNGTFLGMHIATPLQGVAVHINAFNFPVWGMLEKLAPTLLAGVPAIVKPATATSYVTEAAVRIMLDSGILPEGALQLISGGTGDLLDRLGPQDIVSFTGSAQTASMLRSNPNILKNSVRFVAEQDSLNASILGPDVTPETLEFDLFIKEVHREMTTKAGQKCTAIRRIIAPEAQVQNVIEALSARLDKTVIGDPRAEGVRMGALVSAGQKADVLEKAAAIGSESKLVYGNPDDNDFAGDVDAGAFVKPMLFHCENPDTATIVHECEAFGPVSTIMGYRDIAHAIELANKGEGSLVASVITGSGDVARDVGDGRRCLPRAPLLQQRDLDEGIDRSRLAPAPHGAWWPRSCRRRRGNGRRAWRSALYATDRHPRQPGHPDLNRWALGARRDRNRRPRPSIHPQIWRAVDWRDTAHQVARDHAGRYRAFRPLHRRHLLCPHGQ